MEGWTLPELTARVTADAASDDSLDQLDAALATAADLTNRADAVVDTFVASARRDGRSWTEIGVRLGVSKQAARKRFGELDPPTPVLPPGVRIGPRLTTCLAQAGRHAEAGGAAEVGPEHLLAGLLADGVAAAILDKLSVTADAIAASADRLFGVPPPLGAGPPRLSAEAVCAIEAAAHHALAVAADADEVTVGTEHLLLVLALDSGSRARRVLADLGIDIALIKKELACYVAGSPRRARRFGRRRGARPPTCSFCGAAETATRRLVHGPGVTICGTCAQRAAQSATATRRDPTS
jgi:ATP-dependent Clp protease ATP-binding subunit ClpA